MTSGRRAYRFGAENYEYDASGAELRNESMNWDTIQGLGHHSVTTAEGGGWFRTEEHECWSTYHRYTVSRHGKNPITMPTMVLSKMDDMNFDKCPTVDRVKAFAADIFPMSR